MTAPLLDISGLHYRYPGARSDALADLDLTVGEGEFVAVVGANGSGKSTLARLLGGLDRPAAARRADACGHDLLTGDGRLAARRDVGVLFQNPENQLVAEHVEEDVAFGLENLGWPSADIRGRVDEMLARFDLTDLRRREPHLLSGGQKQRAALAGVLAIPRRALVLDEPTAMLDPAGRADVLAAVAALRDEGLGDRLRHAGDGRGRRRRQGRRARTRLRGLRRRSGRSLRRRRSSWSASTSACRSPPMWLRRWRGAAGRSMRCRSPLTIC